MQISPVTLLLLCLVLGLLRLMSFVNFSGRKGRTLNLAHEIASQMMLFLLKCDAFGHYSVIALRDMSGNQLLQHTAMEPIKAGLGGGRRPAFDLLNIKWVGKLEFQRINLQYLIAIQTTYKCEKWFYRGAMCLSRFVWMC